MQSWLTLSSKEKCLLTSAEYDVDMAQYTTGHLYDALTGRRIDYDNCYYTESIAGERGSCNKVLMEQILITYGLDKWRMYRYR